MAKFAFLMYILAKGVFTIMKLNGHLFAERKWMKAGAVMVRTQTSDTGIPSKKYRIDNAWVFNITFTQAGFYRIKNEKNPWTSRGPGEGHLYPPRTTFWEKGNLVSSVSKSAYVLFSGGEAMGLKTLIGPASGWGHFKDAKNRTGILLQKMAEIAATEKEEGYFKVQALFFELIDLLVNSTKIEEGYHSIHDPAEAPKATLLLSQKVRKYYNDHLADPITLEQLANHFMISPSSLSHIYTKEVGEPPMAALRDMRLAHAKLLLLSQQKLKTIAGQTGFYDEYHFSKAFKQSEGLSPRDWVAEQYS